VTDKIGPGPYSPLAIVQRERDELCTENEELKQEIRELNQALEEVEKTLAVILKRAMFRLVR
jgi:prefoldin subunit 5